MEGNNDNGPPWEIDGRMRKRQRQDHALELQQLFPECIIELNPPSPSDPTCSAAVPQAVGVADTALEPESAGASSQVEHHGDDESSNDDEGPISTVRTNRIGDESHENRNRQGRPYKIYRGDNLCPFCGYKCPDEEFPDGAVNHLRRFHSHQYHFTVEVQESTHANQPPSSSTIKSADPASTTKESPRNDRCDSSSYGSVNGTAIVVTAEPIVLRPKIGVDRRADTRCRRTFYYFTSKLPISTGYHQRDEQSEMLNEWRIDLREKMVWDYEDAGENEKRFLSLWNRYWISRPAKGERIVMTPAKVEEFIDRYASHLATLEWELMAHLITLWEHKLLSSKHIEECMIYHRRVQKSRSLNQQEDEGGLAGQRQSQKEQEEQGQRLEVEGRLSEML